MMHDEEVIDDLLDQVAQLKAERDALKAERDALRAAAEKGTEYVLAHINQDLKAERDALLVALQEIVEDQEKFRICCGESLWKAHDVKCWVPKAKAAINAGMVDELRQIKADAQPILR